MKSRFLILFGLVCLALGSLMFIDRSLLGITIDVLQGLLYVASGLFAFAAVMQGPVSRQRYVLAFSLIYAGVFSVGIVNHGSVFLLFKVGVAENFIHLGLALSLLFFSIKEQTLARWFAPAKRTV